MKTRFTLLLFGYLFCMLVTVLSPLGFFDSILRENIVLSISIISIPVFILLLFILVAIRKPVLEIQLHWFFLLSALMFVGSRATLHNELQNFAFIATLFAITASASFLNSKGAWGVTVVIYIIVQGISFGKNVPVDQSEIVEFAASRSMLVAALILTGLVPMFLKRKIAAWEIKERSRKRQLERKMKNVQASVTQSPGISTATFLMNNAAQINSSDSLNEHLSNVVYFISRTFKAYTAAVFTYDSAEKMFKLNTFQSKSIAISAEAKIKLGEGLFGTLGTTKHVFMSGDVSLYTGGELFYYSSNEPVFSVLAVSIMSQDNELLGFILVDKIDKNAFGEQDKEFLKRFSGITAALMTNVRMRLYQEKAAATFQVFYEASHHFTNATKTEDVFEVLFNMVPRMTSFSRMMAITYDGEKSTLTISRIAGEKGNLAEGAQFELNAGLFSFSIIKKRVVKISDMLSPNKNYYRFFPDETPEANLRSLIILPIMDEQKNCIALLSIESDKPGLFTEKLEQTFTILVENASVAYMRAVLFNKMQMLATTDGLTGLNNHRCFKERLSAEFERAKRYKHDVSLLLMDIDHFKSFNDTYGHPVGDLVLKEIAKCINSSIRVNDFPARYGGEEFAVIIPETDIDGVLTTAERIRKTIEQNVIISGDNKLKVTMSIGCAVYPKCCTSQQDLIDFSDKALYYSKEHGRNKVTLFKPEMNAVNS